MGKKALDSMKSWDNRQITIKVYWTQEDVKLELSQLVKLIGLYNKGV